MLRFKYGLTTIDRNLMWTSMHKESCKLKDMEDTHLINIYYYLKDRRECAGDEMVTKVIKELLDERGIDLKVNDGPVPYEVDGIWYYNGLKATEEQVLCYKLGLKVPKLKPKEVFQEIISEIKEGLGINEE